MSRSYVRAYRMHQPWDFDVRAGRVFRKRGKSFPKVHKGVNNTRMKNAQIAAATERYPKISSPWVSYETLYGYTTYNRNNSEREY